MLLSSFKRYVSEPEAEIVEQALSKVIPLESKELLNFLTNLDCKRVVRSDNIHDIIFELAHKELIQKPKYVSHCWSVMFILEICNIFRYNCYRHNPSQFHYNYWCWWTIGKWASFNCLTLFESFFLSYFVDYC